MHKQIKTIKAKLESNALNYYSDVALVDFTVKLSHGDVYEQTKKVADAFSNLGIGKGDSIALFMDNSVESAIVFFALIYIDAVAVPLERDKIDAISVKYALTNEALPSYLLIGHIDIIDIQYNVFIVNTNEYISVPDGTIYLNSTSGSTGKLKFGLTSWENICINASSMCKVSDLKKSDAFMCLFPFHMHFDESIKRGLWIGAKSILNSSISDIRKLVDYIYSNSVTHIMGTPAQLYAISQVFNIRNYKQLRHVECAGGSLSTYAKEYIESKLGTTVLRAWGSTETTGVCIIDNKNYAFSDNYIGRQIDGYTVFVENVDKNQKNSCGEGKMGIESKGNIIGLIESGKFEKKKNKIIITNDIIRISDDGNIFFLGRENEMIKTGGMNVYPINIQRVINTFPGVLNSVVVPLFDDIKGEVAGAYIQVRKNHSVSEEELRHYCLSKLQNYEIPRIFHINTSIPINRQGKTDITIIKEILNNQFRGKT
jgi:long-chain acyl-CoA synthetase